MIDALDQGLVPLTRELGVFARRQPGCRALIARLYGVGPVSATAILAELGTRAGFPPPTTPSAMRASPRIVQTSYRGGRSKSCWTSSPGSDID